MLDTEWMQQGSCRKLSEADKDELFFPIKKPNVMTIEAKKICDECPVLEQCRTWITTTERPGERIGNVAKMSTTERTRLHRTGRAERPLSRKAQALALAEEKLARSPKPVKAEMIIDKRKAAGGKARKDKGPPTNAKWKCVSDQPELFTTKTGTLLAKKWVATWHVNGQTYTSSEWRAVA